MSYMAQWSSKVCIVYPYVCRLRTFLKISTLDFSKLFCMWLRIFDLEKLMQFNFRERFPFRLKWPKSGFSWFFHCKGCVKKTLLLRYGPKCFWPMSLYDLQKCNISLWKSIDSHWFKTALLELVNLQLCLFFFHKMIKFYKSICSAWISRTFAELFFSQIDVICIEI